MYSDLKAYNLHIQMLEIINMILYFIIIISGTIIGFVIYAGIILLGGYLLFVIIKRILKK